MAILPIVFAKRLVPEAGTSRTTEQEIAECVSAVARIERESRPALQRHQRGVPPEVIAGLERVGSLVEAEGVPRLPLKLVEGAERRIVSDAKQAGHAERGHSAEVDLLDREARDAEFGPKAGTIGRPHGPLFR